MEVTGLPIPPQWLTRHGIERFGFHGIAHASPAHYARYSGRPLEKTWAQYISFGSRLLGHRH